MKRLTLVLVVVLVATLALAAPASAKTLLRGTFTSGMATPMAPPDGIWGPTELTPTGTICIVPGAAVGVVARDFWVACDDPEVMPFPVKIKGMWCRWEAAVWGDPSYTIHGVLSKPGYPPFDVTLVATPSEHEFAMHILTVGSVWGWERWDLYGTLR